MSEPFDWTPLFRDRVERLAKLVTLKAPSSIIATEVRMVYEAAWCALGAEAMGNATAHDMLYGAREKAGFCPFCGETDMSGAECGMCAGCFEAARKLDDEDEPAPPSPEASR
jgi:hypothetical protein